MTRRERSQHSWAPAWLRVEQCLAAMRTEHSAWRPDSSEEDQEALIAWYALVELMETDKQVREARRPVDGPEELRGRARH